MQCIVRFQVTMLKVSTRVDTPYQFPERTMDHGMGTVVTPYQFPERIIDHGMGTVVAMVALLPWLHTSCMNRCMVVESWFILV